MNTPDSGGAGRLEPPKGLYSRPRSSAPPPPAKRTTSAPPPPPAKASAPPPPPAKASAPPLPAKPMTSAPPPPPPRRALVHEPVLVSPGDPTPVDVSPHVLARRAPPDDTDRDLTPTTASDPGIFVGADDLSISVEIERLVPKLPYRLERVRELPRRTQLAIGGGVAAFLLLVLVVALASGDDEEPALAAIDAAPPAVVSTEVDDLTTEPVEEPAPVAAPEPEAVVEEEPSAPIEEAAQPRTRIDDPILAAAAAAPARSRLGRQQRRHVERALHSAARDARRGVHLRATRSYERVLDIDPGNARAIAGLAYIAVERGDADRAVQYAQVAVDREPESALFHVFLGDAHRVAGDEGAARRAWEHALSLDPSHSLAQSRMR